MAAPDTKEMQRHELQCGRAQKGVSEETLVQRLRRGGGGQTGQMGKDTAGRRGGMCLEELMARDLDG